MNLEFKTFQSGRLIVSMDFELGWGSVENGLWRVRQKAGVYERLRPVMRHLIVELNALEIPLTWATVGAMIANPSKDQFHHLPETPRKMASAFLTEAAANTRDGRDLFEILLASTPPQDIGSHTFSHTRFSYSGYDEAAQTADMVAARTALEAWGVAPKSFVYPLNHATSVVPLQNTGFNIARVAPVRPAGDRPGRSLTQPFTAPPLVHEANLDKDFRLQSGSMFFNWGVRWDRILRQPLILSRAQRGLEAARTRRGALHVWLHPFNLSETPGLLDSFVRFLRSAAKLRDAGSLDIAPMATN